MADAKVTIEVDGREVEVRSDVQLVEALNDVGIDTPHFCYHPHLKVAGNCRICLIEADGPRGPALMISCYMRARPGMKIRTEASSDRVVKARKGVMEFLLVNHPLDCPICDKAGECTLQEHYMSSGRHESRLEDDIGKVYKGGGDHRFTDTKGVDRGGKQIDLGPTVVLDQERCILCSRCVRFMRDVAGEEQLYLAGRGDTAYITTFPGDQLDNGYDLCTTDICPVGALTGKHFRFQQRVWFLKKVASIAPDDSLGANVWIEYNGSKVWRLMPRRNDAVNQSWMHNDTRLLYQDLDQNRLVAASVNGVETTLADGYRAAGEALSAAKKVAIVTSGHLTNEDNLALAELATGLGERAELFTGSWLTAGEADGIARSGDPVPNRRGCELLGLGDDLESLVARAAEFDCLLVAGNDLWGQDAEKAAALETIGQRIVLASWQDATVAAATIAIGVRCWAEVRGTMTNCQDRIQMLGAVPVCPDPELDPTWQAATRLSAVAGQPLPFVSEADCWRACRARVPAWADITYRMIGPSGVIAAQPEAAAVAT